MGNGKTYLHEGGFSDILYTTIGKPFVVDGIRAKIIKLMTDKKGTHSGLPQYANTSDMYFRLGHDGKPCQAKVYSNRRMFLDFDWSHEHKNSDGTTFSQGVVHVQVYQVNSKGEIERLSSNARLMTDTEIQKYGNIIKKLNHRVKFRP